jgi:uncharacterized protein YigA (DUF484 family)
MGLGAAQWTLQGALEEPVRPVEVAGWDGDALEAQAFGLLVLSSPDAQRFNSGMGTDFLQHVAEIASAALGRLR